MKILWHFPSIPFCWLICLYSLALKPNWLWFLLPRRSWVSVRGPKEISTKDRNWSSGHFPLPNPSVIIRPWYRQCSQQSSLYWQFPFICYSLTHLYASLYFCWNTHFKNVSQQKKSFDCNDSQSDMGGQCWRNEKCPEIDQDPIKCVNWDIWDSTHLIVIITYFYLLITSD